jgi:hypothetical protein
VLLELEFARRDGLEHRNRGADHLWADSVARQEDDVVAFDGCGR